MCRQCFSASCLRHMAPKPRRFPGPAPLPVGLVNLGKRPPPADADKKPWYAGRKGKKTLARAIQRKRELEQQGISNLSVNPFSDAHEVLTRDTSLLEPLRTTSRRMCARLLMFCLQVLIKLVTYWKPKPQLKGSLGMGVWTAPRVALIWHHHTLMSDDHVERMNKVGLNLFCRALEDGEQVAAPAQATLENEWKTAIVHQVKDELPNIFKKVLVPLVNAGALHRILPETADPAKDYVGDCWRDRKQNILILPECMVYTINCLASQQRGDSTQGAFVFAASCCLGVANRFS